MCVCVYVCVCVIFLFWSLPFVVYFQTAYLLIDRYVQNQPEEGNSFSPNNH
jgi:hypothetical protein